MTEVGCGMKKTENAGEFGVTIENVCIQSHFKGGSFEFVCKLLILCLGAYGTIMSFYFSFDFGVRKDMLLLVLFFASFTSFMIFHLKKYYKRIVLCISIIFIIVCIIFRRIILLSIYSLLSKMNFQTLKDNPVKPDLFLYLVVFVVTVLIAYVVVIKNNMVLVILSSLPIACLGLLFEAMPSKFPMACVLMYIAGMAAITGYGNIFKNKSNLHGFIALLIVLTLYFLVIIIIPEERYKRVQLLDSIKTKIENAYYIPQINDTKANGGVYGGKLGLFDKVILTNQTMLFLSTGETGNVYLKGFIGATYSNNSWGDLSKDTENKYKTFFDGLNTKSIEIYNQTSELMKIIDNDKDLITFIQGDVDTYNNSIYKRDYRVELVGENGKYYYLPYGNMYFPSKKSSMDGYPINNKKATIFSCNYSFKNVDYQKYKELIDTYSGSNTNMLNYQSMEKTYRDFVYGSYLSVNSKYKEELNKIMGNASFKNEAEKFQLMNSIKDYLAKNYEYTLEPGSVPVGKDFIDYFLYESKKGYCTYFASAATMLFRAAGIPARYVEGYLAEVNQDNLVGTQYMADFRTSTIFDKTQSYTEYTVSVKDGNAHAWVEIYEDGYGWIPIEVTPGKGGSLNTGLTSTVTYIENAKAYNSSTYNENVDPLDEESAQDPVQLQQTNHEDNTDLWTGIQKFLGFCSIIIGIYLFCMLLPSRIHENNRNKLFKIKESSDLNTQALMLYFYVEKICAYLKMNRTDAMSYKEFFSLVKSKYEYLDKDGIDVIISTALKVRFSGKNITEEEMKKVLEATHGIRKDTYGRLNRRQRFIYRYFYYLY